MTVEEAKEKIKELVEIIHHEMEPLKIEEDPVRMQKIADLIETAQEITIDEDTNQIITNSVVLSIKEGELMNTIELFIQKYTLIIKDIKKMSQLDIFSLTLYMANTFRVHQTLNKKIQDKCKQISRIEGEMGYPA